MAVRNWEDLPGDVVVRILHSLPVKDVIRSTSLQKSFDNLVHSKSFVDSYNRHSVLYGTNPPLVALKFIDHIVGQPQLSLRYNNAALDPYMPLDFPLGSGSPLHSLSSCCNGVVCLFRTRRFLLWNPCIRKTLTLPNPNFDLGVPSFLGLGFVNDTSDYKVLLVNQSNQVRLYSLQHNSWKIIAQPEHVVPHNLDFMERNPVYANGSLYWIGDKGGKNVVGVFDFLDEAFSDISLPEGWDSCNVLHLRLIVHSESSIAGVRSVPGPASNEISYHIQVMDVNSKTWKKHSILGSRRGEEMVVLGFDKEGHEIIGWETLVKTGEVFREFCMPSNGNANIVKPVHCVEASNFVCNLALLDVAAKPEGYANKRRKRAIRRL